MTMRKAFSVVIIFIITVNFVVAQDLDREWLEKLTFEYYSYPVYPLRESDISFQKSLSERIMYSSNVLQSEDEESDTVFSTYLNLGLGFSRPVYDLNFDMLSNYDLYTSNSELSGDEHRLFGQARYASRNYFVGTSVQYRDELQPFDLVTLDNIKRRDITFSLFGGFGLTQRLSLEPELQYIDTTFDDDLFENADNVTIKYGVTGAYQLARQRDLIFEIIYDTISPKGDLSADSNGLTLTGGIRGGLTERLKSLVKVGITRRATDDNPVTGDSVDRTFFSGQVVLIYELTQRTKAEFSFSQDTSYSISGDFDLQTIFLLRLTREFSRILTGTMSVQYGKSKAFGGSAGVDRGTIGVTGQLLYYFRKNLTLSGGASMSRFTGSDNVEDVSSWTIFAGANLNF